MLIRKTFISTLLVAASFTACAEPELVLREGVRLTATTSLGVISVVAGAGVARTYKWDGCSLAASMEVRPNRWFGSLGIYDPAPSLGWPFTIFRICKGVSRTVVEEGQLHFADVSAAEEWIRRYVKIAPAVWSNDGLLVQWSVKPEREQLNVEVWQICVSNQYPKQLAGATDAMLQISRLSGVGPTRRECAVVKNDVVLETQKVWDEFWKEVDQWNARVKSQN